MEEESKEIHEEDEIEEAEEVEEQVSAPIDIDNYTPEAERAHEEKMERIRQERLLKKTDTKAMWKKLEKELGARDRNA